MLSLAVSLEPPNFGSPQQVQRTLRAALKVFDKYYRGRVSQRFAAQGPGWPARAEDGGESRERAASAIAQKTVERKLKRALKNASRRFLRDKGSLATVARRARVIEEFHRQLGGATSPFYSPDKRLTRSVSKLRERVERAEKSTSRSLLGRLPSTMKSKVEGATLVVRSSAKFSGALNDGAVVGHGAEVPPRPFNYFDELDVEVLVEIVENMIITGWSA